MFTLPHITGRRRQPDVGALLRVPDFADVDRRHLAGLAAHTDTLRLPPGRTLVSAGATARELIVILSGEAVAVGSDGTRSVLPAGTTIGRSELLSHTRHPATVVATTPLKVVVVNGPAFRGSLRRSAAA